MFDIIDVISLSINITDVYHWYFMKFYQYENIFRLIEVIIIQKQSIDYLHNNYHYENHININDMFDIVVFSLSINIFDVYHWYFMKFYQHKNKFSVGISNDYNKNNQSIIYMIIIIIMKINDMFDIVVISLSINISDVYHWYFMKFYQYENIFRLI